MAVKNWTTGYPSAIDDQTTNFPIVIDDEDEVMASHVTELAQAVIALETIVGTTSPFPFSPLIANLGTPVVTGTIADVDIADASQLGSLYNTFSITVTDPQSGSNVYVPVILPVTPLPNKFKLKALVYSEAPPVVDYSFSIALLGSRADLAWAFVGSISSITTTQPGLLLYDVDGGVVSGAWNFPDMELGSAVDYNILVEKVAPFTAIPQVKITAEIGNITADQNHVKSVAHAGAPSSGSINPVWETEDFEGVAISIVFPNTIVGAVSTKLSLVFENG